MNIDPLKLAKANNQTKEHIDEVRKRLISFAVKLIDRAMKHDASKLSEAEAPKFAEVTDKLSATTFGSEEYNKNKALLGEALAHHYANNSHHPEHYKDGVNDMSLLDVIEMFADWDASSKRHNDGNINHSIDHNAKRFSIDAQLTKILRNTIKELPV